MTSVPRTTTDKLRRIAYQLQKVGNPSARSVVVRHDAGEGFVFERASGEAVFGPVPYAEALAWARGYAAGWRA